VAVAAVVVGAGTLVAVRYGPAHRDGHGDAEPPALTRQAYALARQEFGLLSGGDWGGAWALWTPDAQRQVPRGDFVRVNTACRAGLGVPYVIDGGTTTAATSVRVRWHHGSATGTSTVRYAAGQWRFGPDPATLAPYRDGPDALIARRRAAGTCGRAARPAPGDPG
jgi:hypothetical protein